MGKEWFVETVAGRYVAEKEDAFFRQYTVSDGIGLGRILRLGVSQLDISQYMICVPEDIKIEAESLPFAEQSLDVVIMAHEHEYSSCSEQVLKEAYRVLRFGGRLLLTGFNPHSLWGIQGCWNGSTLPEKNKCFSLPAFKQKAAQLGFEIGYGRFMVYTPLSENRQTLEKWAFLEKAGDRWWPQFAAVYGLVLLKNGCSVHSLFGQETVVSAVSDMVPAFKVSENVGKSITEV